MRRALPVNINIQLVVGDEILFLQGTPDLDGKPCAHLRPDQSHLGTQAKLPTGLFHTIFGT